MENPHEDAVEELTEEEDFLFECTRKGDVEKVKELLDGGVDLDCREESYSNPMHVACVFGHLEVVELFCKYDESQKSIMNQDQWTPLMFSCENNKFEIIRYLVENENVDVNEQNSDGDTPLHRCCELNLFEISEFLLSFGADPNIVNIDGKFPIDLTTDEDTNNLLSTKMSMDDDEEDSDENEGEEDSNIENDENNSPIQNEIMEKYKQRFVNLLKGKLENNERMKDFKEAICQEIVRSREQSKLLKTQGEELSLMTKKFKKTKHMNTLKITELLEQVKTGETIIYSLERELEEKENEMDQMEEHIRGMEVAHRNALKQLEEAETLLRDGKEQFQEVAEEFEVVKEKNDFLLGGLENMQVKVQEVSSGMKELSDTVMKEWMDDQKQFFQKYVEEFEALSSKVIKEEEDKKNKMKEMEEQNQHLEEKMKSERLEMENEKREILSKEKILEKREEEMNQKLIELQQREKRIEEENLRMLKLKETVKIQGGEVLRKNKILEDQQEEFEKKKKLLEERENMIERREQEKYYQQPSKEEEEEELVSRGSSSTLQRLKERKKRITEKIEKKRSFGSRRKENGPTTSPSTPKNGDLDMKMEVERWKVMSRTLMRMLCKIYEV